METDIIQRRINRINHLLDRLGAITRELDEIHSDLYEFGLTRKQFTDLVTRRQNLLMEKQNKERELKEVYRLKEVEGDDF